uniref:Mothers against decapentaplegic homolog n=1 Tax=Bursaphelenchus xylophilus TaxID=6326 RepID=K9UV32_BURXY|nr:DAF-8 protein [Bursaphelenchus xylophilus]
MENVIDSVANIFDSNHAGMLKRLQMKMRFNTNRSAARIKADERCAETALKAMVKRLRKSKEALEQLERAITSEDPSTACVMYKVSKDEIKPVGSMMKNFPHYTYCKLFRFPDLVTHHQVRSLPHCLYPFNKHMKMEDFCVNPYHYELIENPKIPDVIVPTSTNRLHPQDKERLIILNENIDQMCPRGVPNVSISRRTLTDPNSSQFQEDEGDKRNGDDTASISSRNDAVSPQSSNGFSPRGYMTDDMDTDVQSPCSTRSGDIFSPNPILNSDPPQVNMYPESPSISVTSPQPPMSNDSQWSNRPSSAQSPVNMSAEYHGIPDLLNTMTMSNGERAKCVSVQFTEFVFWCTVGYYEYTTCCSSEFNASKASFVVDGFTSKSDDERFSLGNVTNSKRTNAARKIRSFIGKGARLYYIGGEVFVENMSDYPIFVQSPIASHRYGWHPATVCKVPPQCNFKVFNMPEFAKLLSLAVKNGFESTYSLTRMCSIRISMVKGWGRAYRRHSVNQTPAWIQVHLTAPLQWLDRVLLEMGGPPARCTSFS